MNRQIMLAETPKGKLGPEHFKMQEGAMPMPNDGEVLLKVRLISLDAANRAWMQGATYREAVGAGSVMAGGAIAEGAEADGAEGAVDGAPGAAIASPLLSRSIRAPGSGSSDAWMTRSSAISAASRGDGAWLISARPFRSLGRSRSSFWY